MSRRLPQPAHQGALVSSADELAQAFVSLSSDIALVLDKQGVITRVVQDGRAPMAPQANDWVGQRWTTTVTDETRRKVERLLADASTTGVARKRQVNHACGGTADIPVAYTAMRLGRGGAMLAVGRDLRDVAAIQQRFQATQQELERSYWRDRQSESRYRLLFQVATDAAFVVDGLTQRVREGNHAAQALLRAERTPLAGRVAEQQFDANSRAAVRTLITEVCATGHRQEITARLAGTHIPMSVAASPIRVNDAGGGHVHVLLRVRAGEPMAADPSHLGTPLARLVDTTAEGIVVTDESGLVVVANHAFAQLVAWAGTEHVQGQNLAQWLGHDLMSMSALIDAARQQGIVQMSAAALLRVGAAPLPVDITLSLLADAEQTRFGFTLRPCEEAAAGETQTLSAQTLALAHAIDALCADFGRVPLGSLLQSVEHMARHHIVHKALQHRAGSDEAAAQDLGISVQELGRLRHEHACSTTEPRH
jgi:transcriptional regulator PpsR